MYALYILTKEHGRRDVQEAKELDIDTRLNFGMFEEITEYGQDCIISKWITLEKELHDGMKKNIKVRIIAQGFEEETESKNYLQNTSKELSYKERS